MRRGCFAAVLFGSLLIAVCPAADPDSPFARWEPAIKAFEKEDAKSPPPQGAVLFVGSSSIRLWKLEKSFPNHAVINRGFGGSQIADSVYFADRLVLKHEPKTIVLYAGDNDLAKGKSPEEVSNDFVGFVKVIQAHLPKAKIVFIGIKPSIARWNLVADVQKANKRIRSLCEQDERLVFVDVYPPMIGKNGRPRPELFAKDGLHLSEAGYEVWTKLVLPHLPKTEAAE